MSQKSFQKQSESDAMQELKRRYFEEHGEEMSDTEAEDVRFIAETFAEIAYKSWIGEKKKFLDSKKNVPKPP